MIYNITPYQAKFPVQMPTVTGSFSYTGQEQAPTISGVDEDLVTVGGTLSATAAGTYSVTFTLKDPEHYAWTDGTTAAYGMTWGIARKSITAPSIAGGINILPVTGDTITPELTETDSAFVQLSGDLSASEIGSYEITAHLVDAVNLQWSDGTAADKTIAWSIAEAVTIDITATTSTLGLYKARVAIGTKEYTQTATLTVGKGIFAAFRCTSTNTRRTPKITLNGTTVDDDTSSTVAFYRMAITSNTTVDLSTVKRSNVSYGDITITTE